MASKLSLLEKETAFSFAQSATSNKMKFAKVRHNQRNDVRKTIKVHEYDEYNIVFLITRHVLSIKRNYQ